MKQYSLIATNKQDGKGVISIECINDGFCAFEILGILQKKVIDINDQINKVVTPDIEYTRIVKKTEEKK